jgi:hypothetical protein
MRRAFLLRIAGLYDNLHCIYYASDRLKYGCLSIWAALNMRDQKHTSLLGP